jgi:hypothetical protein
VTRTDANGTREVRTLPGVLPAPAPDVLILDDYEAAHGTATYTLGTSAGTVSAAAVMDLSAGPWLGLPVTPQFSARVISITGYEAGVESRSTVVEPDGSPFPIVITRGASTRSGSLTLWAGDYPAALALLRLAQRGQVIMLRQAEHAGMDMFFTASAASILTLMVPEDKPAVFGVSMDYTEVGRPTAPLSGALGWTWNELKNSFATWADVFAAFETWGDVRTNTRRTP